MSVRYPGQAEIDPDNPRAVGICDRCGKCYNHNVLQPQYQWAGAALVWLGLLVCPPCLDVPSEQLRSIRLPPDPTPIYNARLENFTFDEYNIYYLTAYLNFTMFPVQAALTAELLVTQEQELEADIIASASLSSSLNQDLALFPFGPALLTESEEFILTESGDILTTEHDGFGATATILAVLSS